MAVVPEVDPAHSRTKTTSIKNGMAWMRDTACRAGGFDVFCTGEYSLLPFFSFRSTSVYTRGPTSTEMTPFAARGTGVLHCVVGSKLSSTLKFIPPLADLCIFTKPLRTANRREANPEFLCRSSNQTFWSLYESFRNTAETKWEVKLTLTLLLELSQISIHMYLPFSSPENALMHPKIS